MFSKEELVWCHPAQAGSTALQLPQFQLESTFTFASKHLAYAFIQSDLQMMRTIKAITLTRATVYKCSGKSQSSTVHRARYYFKKNK